MTQTTLQTRRRKPKAQLEEIPPVPEFPNISLLEEDSEPLESERGGWHEAAQGLGGMGGGGSLS